VALKELTKTAVDIVVVDVEIPGINGVELVEKLRAQRFTGVLIVVSAKNDRYYSKRCAQAGANAFISKKQDMENILAAINAAQNGYSYFPFSWKNRLRHSRITSVLNLSPHRR
jgi:two-component system response regulator EvgA